MPIPRRRAGLAIVVLSLSLSQLVSAVTLQDCATRCVTISATTQCNIDSFQCLCQGSATTVVSCINRICSGDQAFAAHKDFATQCRAAGVSVPDPTSATSAPPASTTSSPPQGNTGQQNTPSSPPASTPSSSSTVPPVDPSGTSTRSTSDSSSTAPSGQSSIPDAPSSSTDTNSSNPGSSQQTSPPTETPSGGSSLGSLVGAIVGGLVGGLLVVGLAFFILRRRRKDVIDTDSVHAFRPARADDMSYFSGDSKRGSGPGGILLNDMSSEERSRDAYSPISHQSMGLPPGAAVPFNRGPGSVAESSSQNTTLAARPAVFEVEEPLRPRKGDPPRLPSMRGPASVISESVYSQNTAAPNEGAIPDHISTILSNAGGPSLTQNLTPQQLTAVSAMVNSGLPSTAVVDVIHAMLNENQDAPPGYPGTMIRGSMVPPLPGSVSGSSGSGSGSGSRSGEQTSTNLPYRHAGSSGASS